MRVTTNQVVHRTLLIYSPTTGGLVAPDGLPTCAVIRNGTTDGAVTVTVSLVSTGRYKLSFTVPSGYAVDDIIELVATWAVSGVPGAMLWTMQVDAAVSSRLAAVAYTAPDNAVIAETNTRVTTALPATPPGGAGGVPLLSDPVSGPPTILASVVDIQTDAITAGSLNADAVTEIATGVWGVAGRTLSSISDSAGVTAIKVVTDRLATMIEQIGTSGLWRFVSGALSQAPTGSGGGGGGGTTLQIGPFGLTRKGSGSDGTVTLFPADKVAIRLDLTASDKKPVPVTGTTLTGTLTNAAGTVQASAVSISTTDLNEAEGQLLAAITVPASVGTYQLTITRDNGAADTKTFGPLIVRVERK